MRVLITGANRGIGLEFTRQLLSRGERVFATCRSPAAATSLHDLRSDYGSSISIIQLDVSDPVSIEASFTVVSGVAHSLDLLVNCAGTKLSDEEDHIGALRMDEMLRILTVNSIGPMLVCQRYLDLLRAGDSPRIINISSLWGSLVAYERGMLYAYSASKAALNMLTRRLALETKAQGIIVVAIQPGWVMTDMGGPGAEIAPSESVNGMLSTIDSLTMEDTGRFFSWDGGVAPW
jgi:NAD(P)-dependent dehydrogenase (short-subunit alcohol dehydrogenase family)